MNKDPLQHDNGIPALTSLEREHMRHLLDQYMDAHPLEGMRSPFLFYASRSAAAFAVLLVVTGTSYAAENALPGDILYPIKTQINEKVSGALALSPSAKAAWHAEVATTRLHEAQQLASEDRLTTHTSEMLQGDLDGHASAAASIAADLPEDDVTHVELRANLAALGAEGVVLERVAEHKKEETKRNSIALAERAKSFNGRSGARAFTEASLKVEKSQGASLNSQTANTVRAKASDTLSSLSQRVHALQGKLNATTSASLDQKISATAQLLVDGEHAATTEEALEHYSKAVEDAAVLETYIDAGAKYNGDVLQPFLGGEDE